MTTTPVDGRLRTVDVRRELTRQRFIGDEPAPRARMHAKKTLRKVRFALGQAEAKGEPNSRGLAGFAEEIASAHEPGTLTLVVVNRTGRAQELWTLLEKRTAAPLALIHSRFRPGDRRRIQDAVLTGSFQGVLVATQGIEAGVDLSAKTLFTELAPCASMVQRCGRLNRAGEHRKARAFWIDIDGKDADACLPYETAQLDAARRRLREVIPTSLQAVASDPEEPTLPVLRRDDFTELFDTEPDLAGHDVDISRYVGAIDERDVQVAWRMLGKDPPSAVDLGAGIVVPRQTLSLAGVELGGGAGPPWIDRMQRLLEVFGPFRLAYLEMLLRVADWRASEKRAPRGTLPARMRRGDIRASRFATRSRRREPRSRRTVRSSVALCDSEACTESDPKREPVPANVLSRDDNGHR